MINKVFRLTAVALVFAHAGCTEPVEPIVAAQGIKAPIGSAEFQLQAAANGRIERGIEDDILRMETYVAGLGGVYGDDEGNIVIYVPSTENPREIFAALAKSSPYLTFGG